MNAVDDRDCSICGATPDALRAFEHGLGAFQSWRNGADAHVAAALRHAPAFVMAHALKAYLLIASRDPRRVGAARSVLQRLTKLRVNEREWLHVGAITAALDDDYERAKALLGEVLRVWPRDALALQVAHAFDYLTGDLAHIGARVAAVMPAWSRNVPGYHAVLAMHAFGLEECGEYARAEDAARAALDLNASDARAHHVMAHVFEMSDRPAAGERWMHEHAEAWARDTVVAAHAWWHVALFRIAQGNVDGALALYDERLRRDPEHLSDLIDSAALLWRLHLLGADNGTRWIDLAQAWAPHIDDAFCSFTDVHAMLAFVGARDWDRALRLERAVSKRKSLATRYGKTTRMLGLPACRALIAFGRGDDAATLRLLAGLSPQAHRLGGSHAQRDVLQLTLLRAAERVRRPVRFARIAPVLAAA